MKTNVSRQTGRQAPTPPNTPLQGRPGNKSNLDSRSGEEQEYNGDNQTHNTKEKHSDNKTTKND